MTKAKSMMWPLLILTIVISSCKSANVNRADHSFPTDQRTPSFFSTRGLTPDGLLDRSSSGFLRVSQARVITDNDAAFDSKLEAIRNARAGETVRMSYYIYSDDYSSSYLTAEMLTAARRGVRFKIIADQITNMHLLDHFVYLTQASEGRIEVRFYGRPTPLMIRDAVFMTTPCPETTSAPSANFCSDYKWANLRSETPDFYAKLLLSGMYNKSATAVKAALIHGQQIDIKKFTEGPSASDQDKKDLIEFFKLSFQAKFQGDISARIKVALALMLYGEKLNPILNEIYGRIPLRQMGENSARDWEHSTDFTHQKLLLVGDRFFILGGRNIEDSYHMKTNPLVRKYLFMDTDFAADVVSGGDGIVRSFDRLFDFSTMVIDLNSLQQLMPNDLIRNPTALQAASTECESQVTNSPQARELFKNCLVDKTLRHPSYRNFSQRVQAAGQLIQTNAQIYRNRYLRTKRYSESWKQGPYDDRLTNQDVSDMMLTYIENLPFEKNANPLVRKYGVENGQEQASGKYIHDLWIKGMENACLTSANGPAQRVILHNAYFLPPTNLIKAFAKMIDGTWDCHNVKVTILTNSPESTDLNVINIIARYQMLAFYEIYKNQNRHFGPYGARRSAQFEYVEYKKVAEGGGRSLHTKVAVLGNDIIVGSANADVRSYYMDSNNGVYFRGAQDFVREYSAWVDRLLADSRITRNLSDKLMDGSMTFDSVVREDEVIIQQLLAKYGWSTQTKPELVRQILQLARRLGSFVYTSTQGIVSREMVQVTVPTPTGENSVPNRAAGDLDYEISIQQREFERTFNRLLQLL